MGALLDEDTLRGMFAELGESVEVPPSGAQDALAAIRSARVPTAGVSSLDEARVRAQHRKRLGAVIGVAAVVAIFGVVIASSPGGSSSEKTAGRALSAEAPAGGGAPDVAAPAAAPASAGPASQGLGPQAAALPSASAAAGGSASTGAAGGSGTPSVDADRVVRTGDVNLTVPQGTVPGTVSKLEGASKGLGGYLQDSSTQQADPKSGGIPTASVTLRVPAPQFETLLARVQALGTVTTSTTNGKDVTAQYVDLAARLKALETSRDTYLTILSTAKTVNDTLAIQQRLDGLQQQIEQLQGQQNELGAQSDLATLTVEVSEPAPAPAFTPTTPKAKSGLAQAFDTAGDRFRRGTESVIAALGTIALLLIALIVVLVAGRFGRRAYLRHTV